MPTITRKESEKLFQAVGAEAGAKNNERIVASLKRGLISSLGGAQSMEHAGIILTQRLSRVFYVVTALYLTQIAVDELKKDYERQSS